MIRVIKSGIMTTVQDAGRWGYQAFGITVAGAMDMKAYKVANLLVGNELTDAALEMTVLGGEYEFTSDCLVAITGADMNATLNDLPVANWSSFKVAAGDILRLGFVVTGCRAYLAVSGGLDVPVVLGSRSTHTRSKIGGYQGRTLQNGDELQILPRRSSHCSSINLPKDFVPNYPNEIAVRVILGAQQEAFTVDGIKTLFSGEYTITADADRMGYRLEGAKVEHVDSADIVSDALSAGAIQVPAHGMPIIMMADRQTTGGYTKIGAVIGADLGVLAQAKPGDKVRFVEVDDDLAVAALQDDQLYLANINAFIQQQRENKDMVAAVAGAIICKQQVKTYQISFNQKSFVVEVLEK